MRVWLTSSHPVLPQSRAQDLDCSGDCSVQGKEHQAWSTEEPKAGWGTDLELGGPSQHPLPPASG